MTDIPFDQFRAGKLTKQEMAMSDKMNLDRRLREIRDTIDQSLRAIPGTCSSHHAAKTAVSP